jgi:CHAT domain-containing protein
MTRWPVSPLILAVLAIGSCSRSHDSIDDLLARAEHVGAKAEARWIGKWAATEAPGDEHPSTSLEIQGIQARVEKLAFETRTAQNTEALGVAMSLAGTPERGVSTLAESVLLSPTASGWNNLGVAYLMAARLEPAAAASRRVRALDAFLRAAELEPARPEPRYNVALALERLGLTRLADREFGAVLPSEPNARWRASVDAHRRSLAPAAESWDQQHRSVHAAATPRAVLRHIAAQFPEAVEECVEQDLLVEWAQRAREGRTDDAEQTLTTIVALADGLTGNTFLSRTVAAIRRADGPDRRRLADLHANFARARRFYEDGRYESAASLLRRQREQAGALTPFILRVDLELATVLYQFREVAEARAICERVYAEGVREQYGSITARAQWLQGITLLQSSMFEGALAAYDGAIARYEALGQLENAAAVANAAADTLRILGEHGRGWGYLVDRTFHAFPNTRSVRRRYVALLNASLYASDERLMSAALYFQNASVEAARERGVPNTIVESLSRRATLLLKSGNAAAAEADLLEAKRRLADIPSASAQRYQGAWLDAAAAQSQTTRSPDTAVVTLDRTIEAFERAEPAEVPRLYVARGDAAEALGRPREAEGSYQKAVNAFEQRWGRLSADEHRVFYLEEGWPAYQRLIETMSRGGRTEESFSVAERARARSLATLTGAQPVPPALRTIEDAVPLSTAVAYYTVLDSRLLTWVITAGSSRLIQAPITESRLATLVTTFTGLLDSASDPGGQRRLAGELFDLLVAPLAPELDAHRRLIVIPDGPLHVLPFSALIDRRRDKYLIETHELTLSPSAKELMLATARMAAMRSAAPFAALAAGAVPPTQEFALLPDAARELAAVAAAYSPSTVLSGADATIDRLSALAGAFQVIHLATHARSNSTSPRLSFVQLAHGSTATGRLYAGDISAWSLPRTQLVVLSACDTASGAVYRGEGLVSLARPFLAAGIPSVVATLWPIDDRVSSDLMAAFHRYYARDHNAALALAQAQRRMIADQPQAARVREWASFVSFGGMIQEDTGRR